MINSISRKALSLNLLRNTYFKRTCYNSLIRGPTTSIFKSSLATFMSTTPVEEEKTVDDLAAALAIDLPTNENNPNLLKIRHSSAHILAMAVQRVFPSVRVTIGPWIDNG
jgi:hypothetical protein